MDSANEEESIAQRKKAAALQRIEDHITWQRAFFQARPPPPPIGQLHRRQHGKTKNRACHAAFQCALALHQCAEAQDKDIVEGGRKTNAATDASATTAAVPSPLSKQEAWAAQLHGEKERRNPSADLNVRSDPTRTVIMANLHPDTVEEDLRHFADQFGRVVNVRIVRHHKTGKSRRYAFVEFGLAGEARKALLFHRKKRLKGHAVIIDKERGRTEAGFLPKRIATAETFLASQATLNGGRTNATAKDGDEARASTAIAHPGGSTASAAGSKNAVLPLPDDDADFLNSILNS
ncbi:putative U1 small nuclear ribonucleoprotein [Leptomonas pyrrhocoris]|uniref:Putative U1 small nuclear ribonucleoprotein n=1 Tax=Leptomonas pyrrhocoris TaxID=157538 RepID=A0A0M9FXE7_LEPPY|nr:putative U1 small nuclear ribonucleoprotein [Leptomonas pyrrhocoris]KPA78080.1 putative U1 small nuclear ribonucleoprotein [Leptomonas pyrrhocoris]|eukprot:XP_015656519.1 putative U1 small nuclear ribonucleoprotein [Leptomonas pyrrhocoris]